MKSVRIALAMIFGLGLAWAIVPMLQWSGLGGAQAAPAATTRYVLNSSVTPTSDSGDCTNQLAPCRTVQYALSQAANGDTIRVANDFSPAVYTGTIFITKSVVLEGGWGAVSGSHGLIWQRPSPCEAFRTVLDAQGAGRVISITNSSPTIDCFTITGGDATGLGGTVYGYDVGGGVHSYYANTTIANCVITDNVASTSFIGWGGGLSFYGGTVTLRDSLVMSNVASTVSNGYGGGAYFRSGQATVTSNTVEGNVAATNPVGTGFGGGLWVANDNAMLAGNTVRRNVAGKGDHGYGGGIDVYMATASLEGGVVSCNTANATGSDGHGGGISARQNASLTVLGVEIHDNTATFGGGICIDGSDSAVVSGTQVYSNTSGMGGGFYIGVSPTATLANNDIYSNTSGYGAGLLVMGSRAATLSANRILSNTSTGLAGGVWLNCSDDAILTRNLIRANQAHEDGGAVHLFLSDRAELVNNMVVSNTIGSGGNGAGIYVEGSTAELLHTTLARNTGGDGSGLSTYTSTIAMSDTIVASHTVGITIAAGSAVTMEATLWGAGDWANGTNTGGPGSIDHGELIVVGDPGFVAPDRGDYHIGQNSDALDAGLYTGVGIDIDGDIRPIGAGFDIGADEARLQAFLPLVLRVAP